MQEEYYIPVNKTLPCLKCGSDTTHKLISYDKGAAWQCVSCKNYIHAYTFEEMTNFVAQAFQSLFRSENNNSDMSTDFKGKVFLKHYGPDAEEKEASQHTIKEHIQITGRKPEVGQPLFARASSKEHLSTAVPFGEVVRVEE